MQLCKINLLFSCPLAVAPRWGLGVRLTTSPRKKKYFYETSRGGQDPPRAVEPMMMIVPWLLYMFRAILSLIIRSIYCSYSFWFYSHVSLSAAFMAQPWKQPTTIHVNKTRSCNYSRCSWWWVIISLETCRVAKGQGNNKFMLQSCILLVIL